MRSCAPPETADGTRWAAQALRDERERWLTLTLTALRDAKEIASGSVTEEPDARGRDGRTWSGAADAREWTSARLSEIASETGTSTDRLTDVRVWVAELRARLAAAGECRYMLRGLWPEGTYGVLAAEPKAQKTWAAVDMAVSVASGTPWLGHVPVDAPGPVLFFYGESGDRGRASPCAARHRHGPGDLPRPVRCAHGAARLRRDLAQVHRPTTRAQAETHLRRHVYPTFGDRPLGTVRRTEVQAWVTRLSETLAPATVRCVYSYLAAVFRAAVEDRLISTTSCARIALPKVSPARVEPLAVTAVEALADAVPDRFRALIVLAAGTGLRQGEALVSCA